MRRSNTNTMLLVAAGAGLYLAARTALRWRRAYNWHEKVVLITGGSRGLGLVLARQLLHQGARVAICARDEAELRRARLHLGQDGGQVLAIPCDVTNRERVEAMVHEVREALGQIDVLINNAGIIQVAPAELMTSEDYEEALRVHFWGPFYATMAALPDMRQRRWGRIVNISSIGGKVSMPHLLPYNVSKFALVGYSQGLRAELAKDNILVTTVCPGLMRTGSPRHAMFKGQHRAEFTWFSISDALPGLSISAERAARQILQACRRGDAEVVLSLPAKLATTFHALFPGLTADLLGLANTFLLPAPGGVGTMRVQGSDSHSSLSPSWLTALSDRAAQRHNEVE